MNRRMFLKAGTSLIATATTGAAAFEPRGYPDPDLVILDPDFAGFLVNAPIQKLYSDTDMYWAEGPAWSGWGNYLVWSDIPNNLQHRWLNDDQEVTVLRRPSNFSNGNTFDTSGRQISFEHAPPAVRRYEPDGTQTVLAERFDGKSLNGPNDGVVHPNGDVWFSDPGYGGLSDYEGKAANTGSLQPYQKESVFRIDMKTGVLHKVSDESVKPNGLCFSPDYKKLYIADTGAIPYGWDVPSVIRVWDVIDESRLANGRVFADMSMRVDREPRTGVADGIRCDANGYVWAGAGWAGDGYNGVHIFNTDGERVAHIRLPEICSNLCFGGPIRNRLFMTASQSLYAVYTNTRAGHFC